MPAAQDEVVRDESYVIISLHFQHISLNKEKVFDFISVKSSSFVLRLFLLSSRAQNRPDVGAIAA